MRGDYIQQKGYQFVEMWECEWWRLDESEATVKKHLRKNFPYTRPLSGEQLLQGLIDGKILGFVQCDNEIPDHLQHCFSKFPRMFRTIVVGKRDFGF